jgi:hypothetical protein
MKNKIKIKIIILATSAILLLGSGIFNKANAENALLYVSPTNLTKKVGEVFDIYVKVNPNGQKVCAVEGRLALNKLSCQKITLGSNIIAQSSPSCENPYFLLGIPGCTTNDTLLFTVTVKGESVGLATANFTGVDIIGEGKSISSSSAGGNYTLLSPCSCGDWSTWQNKNCGGGTCSPTQRLQVRTRTCTPSGCEAETQYRCVEDSSCIARYPTEEKKIEEKKPVEQATETEKVEKVEKPEKRIPQQIVLPEVPQQSLLATLAMAWKEFTKSPLLTTLAILSLVGLVIIGVKEWKLRRKKK